jgi:hypothetical protein
MTMSVTTPEMSQRRLRRCRASWKRSWASSTTGRSIGASTMVISGLAIGEAWNYYD